MDIIQLLENFLGSEITQQIMTIGQSIIVVIVTYLSSKLKTKITDVTSKYESNLEKIRNDLGISQEALEKSTAALSTLTKENIATKQTNSVLVQVIGILALDSKSIPANSKLVISKLLGSIDDSQAVKQIEQTIQESSELEKQNITVEEVNEIKQTTETIAENSRESAESIAQQSLNIYSDIVNE